MVPIDYVRLLVNYHHPDLRCWWKGGFTVALDATMSLASVAGATFTAGAWRV